MKYEIMVEGGFTGIPKKYAGELKLSDADIASLTETMSLSSPINTNLRDGYIYHVTLFDSEKSIEAQFDEKSLPRMIRQLLK